MGGKVIVVKAARDQEAGVWFVESSDVPGLNLEADSLDDHRYSDWSICWKRSG